MVTPAAERQRKSRARRKAAALAAKAAPENGVTTSPGVTHAVTGKKIVRISKRGVVNEGCPPKYPDPAVMEKKLVEYFAYCDNRTADKVDDDGKTVTYPNPQAYSIAGLCYWMGFANRQALDEYEKKPAFSVIVKRARMKVESFWEERLADKAPVGSIFWLKNHAGYSDKADAGPAQIVILNFHRRAGDAGLQIAAARARLLEEVNQ
jgi:hypothetical protein